MELLFYVVIALLILLIFQLQSFKRNPAEHESFSEVRRYLTETKEKVSNLKENYESRKIIEDESQRILRKLETVLTGSRSKGAAGENILREALSIFPPGMLMTNYRIGSKVVEFALCFSHNKKILPIDSKWPATQDLMELERETNEKKIEELKRKIEKEVLKKIKEVTTYIDPTLTLPWAIVALPDAVFKLCYRIHNEAYQRGIFLVPYSLSLTYLLTFYELQLKTSLSAKSEELESFLLNLNSNLNQIEEELNNKLAQAIVRTENAHRTIKESVSKIRAASSIIKKKTSDD